MNAIRLTNTELDKRIWRALDTQHKYVTYSGQMLTGWDKQKIVPTAKALLVELGLVEIVPEEGGVTHGTLRSNS